jgi:citrate synthase
MDASVVSFLKGLPKDANTMEVLRTTVSLLSLTDVDDADSSHDANIRKSFRLTAQVAMIVAYFDRIRKGKDIVEPDTSLSHAANFLWMLNGVKPIPEEERAFDVALVLHADHELNASTFAARVIAATLSDTHSAITGAIGALKGPLHGGANEAVMKLLYEIDAAHADPVEYVRDLLARKVKISGFGHRVYKTEDPRATHLRRMSKEMSAAAGNTKWYDMSEKVEQFVRGEKKLNANVDFYSASTYTTLGIDMDIFTPIFAVSRISGWCAHVIEQHDNNRLIRPRAEYTGPAYPAPYVPLSDR